MITRIAMPLSLFQRDGICGTGAHGLDIAAPESGPESGLDRCQDLIPLIMVV